MSDAEHPPFAQAPAARAWRVAPTTAWVRSGEHQVTVMDLDEGNPQVLSPTGSAVWELLLDGRTPEDDLAADPPKPVEEEALCGAVAEAFGVDVEVVAADTRAFLAMLAGHRLVVPAALR